MRKSISKINTQNIHNMNQNVTEIQGRSFRLDENLLSKIKQAKQFLEPKHEREVREKQLFTHSAKCYNHSQSI